MTQAVSSAQAQAIIESTDDAILSKDPEGIITSWNRGAQRLYGYSPEEAIGRHISILIPPHRANEENHILETIMGGGRVDHYETERLRKDGTIVVISLTVSPIRDEGRIIGASVIARDITEARRVSERAARLQRLTQALSRELSSDRVTELLVEEAVPAVGAEAAVVGLVDSTGEEIALVAARGYTDAPLEDWSTFPVAADVPVAATVRTGQPIWSHTVADSKERFPDLGDTEMTFEALACVPLTVDDVTLGAVVFSWREPREFSADERAFMMATAQQAANALDRTRIHERERAARDQLAFIARSSEILGSTLDPNEILQALAAIAVPQVADWCVVHLVNEAGGYDTVAVAHEDAAKVDAASELQERYPTDPEAPRGVPAVLRSGEPELYPEIPDAMLVEAATDDEHLALLRELDFRSAMVVPLIAGERTLGAITFVGAESERRYGEDDLTFALELARHAALAIDNSHRYLREHEAAVTLQRALLPERLPETPGIELAARYLPAGPGVEAGGDWYDAIDLGDGRFDVIIGDVSGRGIPAASVMGRLRTAVHAYALDRLPPAETAERVDRLLSGLEGEEMATMLLLRFDMQNHCAEFVRAGHPPALVREPGGEVFELDGEGGSPPLGLMLTRHRPSASKEIAPGSSVLLYTDGLIERRGEVIDEGVARLKRAFADCEPELEPGLDSIIAAVAQESAADDVAALLMRVG